MVGWKRANSSLDNQYFLQYNYSKMTTKNEQIKATMAQTKIKRQTQVRKVFEVKIDESHLNKDQQDSLKMMFVEGK